ncbi:phage DNA packaging protein J [Edwardsiella tarda]
MGKKSPTVTLFRSRCDRRHAATRRTLKKTPLSRPGIPSRLSGTRAQRDGARFSYFLHFAAG